MADLKDKIIGGFRVLQEIQAGSGSQGAVFKAVCDEDIHGIVSKGSVVALKVMPIQDESMSQWRKLEKRTRELASLEHPNIVQYYGCFAEQGAFNDVHVVVQEFLDGETLKDRLARCPSGLDVDEALRIADEVLAGLVYTTSAGIVHRDIKPGNIFLCRDGGVKLIDFEIAQQAGGTTTASAGNLRGSFDYMAPDFIDAEFHGDVKSDVFSMGVVLHEMLCGKTPYQRLSGAEGKQANFAFLARWANASSNAAASPIHVSSRIRRLLAHTDEVFSKTLTQNRSVRYADFTAFRDGIKAFRFRNLRNGHDTYQMLQFIGKGGFGEVFKARVKETGRLVAIKHLLKASYADRFRREAKIMKKLDNPCFVKFVDFFTLNVGGNEEAFLAMQFLDGMPGNSLRDAIRHVKSDLLDSAEVFVAFERYAKGLKAMHDLGIFHRDIKPSNLYFPEGHPERAAIMDLGIARDVNGTATHGMVPGTLDYMPPEVVIADSRGDGGMDIYALGLCLYEALAGKPAYPRLPTGTAAYSTFFERTKSGRRPAFDAKGVSGDGEVLSLLNAMTDLDPSRRLHDAGEVANRIFSILKTRYPSIAASLTAVGSELVVADEGETVAPTVALEPATQGTVATQWHDAQMDAIAREREAFAGRRRSGLFKALLKSVLWLVVVGLVAAGGYFSWPYMQKAIESLNGEKNLIKDAERKLRMKAENRGKKNNPAVTVTNSPVVLPAPTGKTDDEDAARVEEAKRDARNRIMECVKADGSLDDRKYSALAKWSLPKEAEHDEATVRQLSRLASGVETSVGVKLELLPVDTRRNRLAEARAVINNRWSGELLSKDKLGLLDVKITTAEAWSVGVVHNSCGEAVMVGREEIASGASRVLKVEDGHPEKMIVKRVGYKPMSVPHDIDGREWTLKPEMFTALPVPVNVPDLDDGVTCMIDGNSVEPRGRVHLLPGKHICKYSRQTYIQQSMQFKVEVGSTSFTVPKPAAWEHTKEFLDQERETVRIKEEREREEQERKRQEQEKARQEQERQREEQKRVLREKESARVAKVKADSIARFLECMTPDGTLDGNRYSALGDWVVPKEAVGADGLEDAKSKLGECVASEIRANLTPSPVGDRRARLARARAVMGNKWTRSLLSAEKADDMARMIDQAEKWKVGVVRNGCGEKIKVGGTLLGPGGGHLLKCEDGHPENIAVELDGCEPMSVPADIDGREWTVTVNMFTAKPVLVSVPKLEEGVVCIFEGRELRPGTTVSLSPGSYRCEYRRDTYKPAIVSFEVRAREEGQEFPAPSGWRHTDEFYKLEDIMSFYESGDHYEVVKLYYDVFQGGYALSAEDRDRIQNAFRHAQENLNEKIAYCDEQIKLGRNLTRNVNELEQKRAQLLKWYNRLKR